jgi:light-regulated signal transduction histidine kinase (bacteriophytochrome)
MTRQQVADLGAHMQFERKLYEVPHPPGFGLTIAKRLTELHAGKMTIESEIGRGTCVTIELPT